MERKLAWQKGAAYVVMSVGGFIGLLFSWMGNQIYIKVTSIDEKLNKSELVSTAIVEQYKSLDRRVQIIEQLHAEESRRR